MRRVTAVILLGLVVQATANKIVAIDISEAQDFDENSLDSLVGNLVDELLDWARVASPLHPVDLDDTSLGFFGNPFTSATRSRENQKSSSGPNLVGTVAAKSAAAPVAAEPSFDPFNTGTAVGVSGVLGYCVGKAAKSATERATVAVGAALILVTMMSKAGYVKVDFEKIERDVLKVMDFNNDGQLDAKDYTLAAKKFTKTFTDNGVGSVAGFTGGFYYGFRT